MTEICIGLADRPIWDADLVVPEADNQLFLTDSSEFDNLLFSSCTPELDPILGARSDAELMSTKIVSTDAIDLDSLLQSFLPCGSGDGSATCVDRIIGDALSYSAPETLLAYGRCDVGMFVS